MRGICKGRTVFVIAHRLSTVRDSDRIITIEAGQIVEDGTHAELLKRGGRYARLWQCQATGAPVPATPAPPKPAVPAAVVTRTPDGRVVVERPAPGTAVAINKDPVRG
jgi:subfamily B ATP-binding cassette protein HlyB/CyaB